MSKPNPPSSKPQERTANDNRSEPLIFESGSPGQKGYSLPPMDVPAKPLDALIPAKLRRKKPAALPEVSELDVVRHFTRLSQLNFSIDTNFYPLGSCTMKYNPKVNEKIVSMPGFAELHPYQPEETTQGTLELLYHLERILSEICGMAAFTLQPSAGAHGEFTGLLIIRAHHVSQGNARKKILVPDSAHGTNPATAALLGYEVVQIPTNAKGHVDLEALRAAMTEEVAALMLTNPSTLGIFEEEIAPIAKIVHAKGGLLYYDGANLNALLGRSRPGDMGFDVVHVNVHKTFTQPHGGGGPGAGPVGVSARLEKFLPIPRVKKEGEKFTLVTQTPDTIGRVRTFAASTGVMVRTYSYIRANGKEGLLKVSEHAVLNANYLLAKLRPYFDVPYGVKTCLHEFVLSGNRQKAKGVRTLDIAKRLLDYGCYAPTVYFPLIVEEAIMVEPTETESQKTMDGFVRIVETILKEIDENPELVRTAPHTTPVSRLDEVTAARKPVLRYKP